MAAIQYQPKISLEMSDLLQLVDQLEVKDLQHFAQQVEDIIAKKKQQQVEDRETELLKKVDLDLVGEDKRRYEELREYRREGSMTDEQHEELLRLSDKKEKLNLERMRALVELSKIRAMPVDELMKSLQVFPYSYEHE